DERGPARGDLRDEGVAAALDAVPPSRLLLDHAGRGREVRRAGLPGHVGVSGRVEGDGVDHGAPRAAEVRGVEKLRTVGAQLRDEPAETDDTATTRQLDRVDEREVAGRRAPRDVRVAGGVDRDARGRIVSLAAQERRIDQRASVDAEPGDASVAR